MVHDSFSVHILKKEKIYHKSYAVIVSENVFVRTGAGWHVPQCCNATQYYSKMCSGVPHCAGVCLTIEEKPGARDCAWCDHTDRPHHTTPHHTIPYHRFYRYTKVKRPQLLTTTKDTPLPLSHVCMFPNSSNELNEIYGTVI